MSYRLKQFGRGFFRSGICLLAALLCQLISIAPARADQASAFEVSLDPQRVHQPVTGRLYVFLQRSDEQHTPTTEPRAGPDWFSPEPFFGIDVLNFAPDQTIRSDDSADSFPDKLSHIAPGHYRAQAILDRNPDFQDHAKGVGNFYSAISEIVIDPQTPHVYPLVLDQVVAAEPWPDSRGIQEVRIHSDLLSAFHHRDITDCCAVVLPPSYYDQPQRRYPVVYIIPGFGSDHRRPFKHADLPSASAAGDEFIRVYLSGQTKWGHHEFADSATNGPRGQALVNELMPEIDRRYRTIPERNSRFLFGHSSGGWAALWLMVTYPEVFGGVWAGSPDPVDFRDFQGINLYADPPQNMYVDEAGQRRPVARRNDQVWIWFDTFAHMDDVLKRGGQLRSFEAVFSPLDPDGQPQQIWNRQTGRIDPQVARAWQKYDLRLVIEQNWPRLKPLLAGRVHIITGDKDTFYLDGAVRLLDQSLKQLGSDAEVILLPGRGHIDYLTPEFYARVLRQMSDLFRQLNPPRQHGVDGKVNPAMTSPESK